jgi:hypothetical protein
MKTKSLFGLAFALFRVPFVLLPSSFLINTKLAFLDILRKQKNSKEKPGEEGEAEHRKTKNHQTPIKFANLMNEIYARSCGMHV